VGSSRFGRFYRWILQVEGGLSEDPRDTGGTTYAGLTAPALARIDRNADGRWDYDLDGDGDVDGADVRALKGRPDLVEAWYRTEIWDRLRGDALPWPIALHVTDMAVNSGLAAAVLALQRALNGAFGGRGHVDEDGRWGPATAQAAMLASDAHTAAKVTEWFGVERSQFYGRVIRARTRKRVGELLLAAEGAITAAQVVEQLRKAEVYGAAYERGWYRRLELLRAEAARA